MRQILTLIARCFIRCPLKCEVRVVVDRYGFSLPIAECTSLLQHLLAIAPDQLLTIANFPEFILFIFPLCRLQKLGQFFTVVLQARVVLLRFLTVLDFLQQLFVLFLNFLLFFS